MRVRRKCDDVDGGGRRAVAGLARAEIGDDHGHRCGRPVGKGDVLCVAFGEPEAGRLHLDVDSRVRHRVGREGLPACGRGVQRALPVERRAEPVRRGAGRRCDADPELAHDLMRVTPRFGTENRFVLAWPTRRRSAMPSLGRTACPSIRSRSIATAGSAVASRNAEVPVVCVVNQWNSGERCVPVGDGHLPPVPRRETHAEPATVDVQPHRARPARAHRHLGLVDPVGRRPACPPPAQPATTSGATSSPTRRMFESMRLGQSGCNTV